MCEGGGAIKKLSNTHLFLHVTEKLSLTAANNIPPPTFTVVPPAFCCIKVFFVAKENSIAASAGVRD